MSFRSVLALFRSRRRSPLRRTVPLRLEPLEDRLVLKGEGNEPPTDLQLASARVVREGDTLTLTGSFADFPDDEAHSVLVEWGDGKQSMLSLPVGVNNFTASHVYAGPFAKGEIDGGNASLLITATVFDSEALET